MVSDIERAWAAEDALASIRLEGGHIDDEMQEVADRYAAGELSADDLDTLARTGALPVRHG
ncbi:MAG TPA: antitoxin VbhA family protein [Acidimicrobiales bacterium]|jgi:hypothetical protein|nr:antitoxin VbhA family protein [Acidimicrobiales bacterium]